MFRTSRHLVVFFILGVVFRYAYAQTTSKPDFKRDYSNEAFVVEQSTTHIAFENNGTNRRDASARIRIQSDAGVQRYGLLTFSYENSTESIAVDYVRVLKPDGTVVPTPAENMQDMATQITREAPFYSDLREKHVAVKGLGVGDILEFRVQWQNTKPLAPGQFWYAYSFSHDGIILQEQLQIKVPRERAVKWKSPSAKPVITEDGDQRLFTWNSSELEHKSTEQEKAEQETKLYQIARGHLPNADVQISSFQTWEDVGRWYGGLQQERVKPSPEVRAKAAELTKGAGDDNAKLRAIYKYVSIDFRYIGIAFGIGRYQPHFAAEVLANQYGDCKDKHTLLASLLDAAGIRAYPALISTAHEVDDDIPSPGQFDHVISLVPQANGFVWLDTTAEVAPFGYLLSPLRAKHALAIPDDKPPTLMATPADAPSKALQTFKIDAKLSDTGTLEGKIERTLQGDDGEVLVRSAFRRVPMPQWKDLIQQISYGSGFAGDVSEVTAGSPEKIDEPFHFGYNYKRKDYPNWRDRQISSPLPPMIAPASDVKPSHPILLGAVGKFQYDSIVELPKGYSPTLPQSIDLKEDFAEYHASYSIKDGALATARTFELKMQEVPLAEYEAFKKFAQAVSDDHEQYVTLSSGNSQPQSQEKSLQSEIWALPPSENPEAMRAYESASNAAQNHNLPTAIEFLKQAVQADPHFIRARMFLAQLYKVSGQGELTLETLRAAREADPNQSVTYKALVMELMGTQKYEEAVTVLREVVKTNPQAPEAFYTLGIALYDLKRYDASAEAVESAIRLHPDRASYYSQLGSAYLRAGNEDRSVTAFKKALELDPQPFRFNNIGYELADANKQLPLALEYAQKAVREEEEKSKKVTLSNLKTEDLDVPRSLAADWDTLGWVYFRMKNYDEAEKYLTAAWTLSPKKDVRDHVDAVHKQQHKNVPEPDSNLLRTIKLQRLAKGNASAELFVLLSRNATNSSVKIEEVKFIGGSEELRAAARTLETSNFKFPFPDDGPTRLVRRGILACYPVTGCSFVLYNIVDVHSVN
jgi:tetratricopeptide (TPR) repeat protein